jgi:hypothetical protein
MVSQPELGVPQLTVGIMTRAPLARARAPAGMPGCRYGRARAVSTDFARALWDLAERRFATDGVGNGPVSRWQPEAQPVAAVPVKVGADCPRLDDWTPLVWASAVLVIGAAVAPLGATASAIISDSRDRREMNVAFLRITLP